MNESVNGGSVLALFELPSNHQHIQLVEIVETHLVTISAEEDEFGAHHDSRVTIPRAWTLASHNVGIVHERLHELGVGCSTKLGYFVWCLVLSADIADGSYKIQ